MEYNQLYIEYKLPEGATSETVKKDLEQISQYLKEKEEVTHITTSIGGTPGRYNLGCKMYPRYSKLPNK